MSALSIQQEGNGPIDLRRRGPWRLPWLWYQSADCSYNSQFWRTLRRWRPSNGLNGLRGQIWPNIWISNPDYPGTNVHVGFNNHFGGLWGHNGLQMTFEVKFGLGIEFSDLNYPCNHVFLVSICHYFTIVYRRLIMIHWPACFAADKKERRIYS